MEPRTTPDPSILQAIILHPAKGGAEFIDDPDPALIEQCIVESLHRISALADNPDGRIGAPGSTHLVYVYGSQGTTAGRIVGFDMVRMPLCEHGAMPPLAILCSCCGEIQDFEYVPEQGAYYPVIVL